MMLAALLGLVLAGSALGASIRATVIEVQGVAEKAQLQADHEKPHWEPITQGEKLGSATLIRTGLNSKVVLKFEDRGTTQIGPVTKGGIAELAKTGNHVKTRMGMKYGTMKVKVDSSRGTNDYSVSTPDATAAVTGTSGNIGVGLSTALDGKTGTWSFSKNRNKQNLPVSAGQSGNSGNMDLASNLQGQNLDPGMGDVNGGLTAGERNNLINNGGGQAIFSFAGSTNTTLSTGEIINRVSSAIDRYHNLGANQAYFTISSGRWIEDMYNTGSGNWSGTGTWANGSAKGTWVVRDNLGYYEGVRDNQGNWSGNLYSQGEYGLNNDTPTIPFVSQGIGSGTSTIDPGGLSGDITSGKGIAEMQTNTDGSDTITTP
jgi:hypothetical protein